MVPSKWLVQLYVYRDDDMVFEAATQTAPDGKSEHSSKADTLHVRRNLPRLMSTAVQAMVEALSDGDDDPFAGAADFDQAPF